MSNEFSVCIFYPDDTYEYTARFVNEVEALSNALIDQQNDQIVRVIITDGGDCIAYEWIKGKGRVWPKL
jgi:hypothetical protein